jgi:hypothetical protein
MGHTPVLTSDIGQLLDLGRNILDLLVREDKPELLHTRLDLNSMEQSEHALRLREGTRLTAFHPVRRLPMSMYRVIPKSSGLRLGTRTTRQLRSPYRLEAETHIS